MTPHNWHNFLRCYGQAGTLASRSLVRAGPGVFVTEGVVVPVGRPETMSRAVVTTAEWARLSRSPWNFGGGPMLDQAASSLVGVTAVAMVWSRATRSAGRCR